MMRAYTESELRNGDGLFSEQATKAFSYDDGRTWYTCELNEGIRGEPTDVYTVPPVSRGGWEQRA